MKILQEKGFKIFAVVLSCMLIVVAAYFFFSPAEELSAQDAKPIYKGKVYSATRGGHMVFTTITIDPNREMISGTIAGRLPLPNNNGADAIEMSKDQKTIYYPTWNSTLYTIDISAKEPKIIAEKKFFEKETKMCGSHIGPDGKLYLSSMSFGDIHKFDVSDPKDPKLMDRVYKTTYLCGVQVLNDGKYIFTTDMKDHKIYVYDAKTHEKIKEITPGGKEFLHRARLSPDGKLLYQASTGSTTPDANGRFYIVDTKKMKVKDTVVFGVNYDAHDVATTPDGKYAIAAVRRVPAKEYKDSEYIVVNLQNKRVIGSISMCKSCHNAMGVDPEVKSGREVFICGIQIAWEK